MLRIRLRKPGKSVKGRTHYKIVVIERAKARESRFIDELGYYDPECQLLEIKVDKYESWIKKGAKPSETVAALFKQYKKNKQSK